MNKSRAIIFFIAQFLLLLSYQETNASPPLDTSRESQPVTFSQEVYENIRSYLLENYFGQPDNLPLICFEIEQFDCPHGALRVKWENSHKAYIGVSSCTSGNCDYFIFNKENNFSSPVLETFGYSLKFNRKFDAGPADITVIRRGDISTHQVIVYTFSSGAYRPKKCFEKTHDSNLKTKSKKINCNELDL